MWSEQAKGERRKARGDTREGASMARKKTSGGRVTQHGRPRSGKPVARLDFAGLRRFCLELPGVTEDVKWGEDLVWSVGRKMFAACHESDDGGPELPVGFKCSDEDFERLTGKTGIIPAPYAARFGWVSVRERGALSQKELERLVGEAYRLVGEAAAAGEGGVGWVKKLSVEEISGVIRTCGVMAIYLWERTRLSVDFGSRKPSPQPPPSGRGSRSRGLSRRG